MIGNIDSDFLHHLNRLGVNVAGGIGTGTLNVERISRSLAENAFGHMASAGIAGAKDEDGWFHMLHAKLLVPSRRISKPGSAGFIGTIPLTSARSRGLEGVIDPSAGRSHFVKAPQIVTKPPVSWCAVLEALQVGFELGGGFGREPVDHPRLVPCAFDQSALSQVSEMLGDLGLGKPQDFLKVANA